MTAKAYYNANSLGKLLLWVLDPLVARQGDMVALVEAYFDESGAHHGSPILCVAGYLYEREKCLSLDKEWAKILEEYDLPYFRMVSCAHGNPPFDELSLEQRICAQKKAFGAIERYASHGLTITVVEEEYNQSIGLLDPFGAAYAWCCFMCLVGVERWADKNNYTGEIAYFFEAGHVYQTTTNKIMKSIFDSEKMRQAFRYGSHSFVDKKKVRPIQSADILAWQAATFKKRQLLGNDKPRKDLKALIDGTNTEGFHGDKETFEGFEDYSRSFPQEIKDVLLGK